MTESGAPEKRSSSPVGHGEGDVSPSASDIRSTERGSGVSPSPPLPRSSKPSVAEPLVEGTVLQGTYKVMGLLGRGAMGAVYLVEHIGLGKQFAAKVVDGDRALDASAVARLRNEARITSAIEHENIVNVTHFGQTDDGRVFIVMELLRGQDLRKRMTYQALEGTRVGADPWLPDSEVRAIVGPLLSALAAAHAEGVVHRDLKPDNIFLSESKSGKRRPKVVDFGIGKLHTDAKNDLRLTDTGSIIGTPLYMAPEQSRSSREVDHRADLYSMGVMIFEMMCARPPFEAAHVFEMVVKHATEEPPDPRSIRPDIPEPVAAVILRSLAKEPSERFASANEMLEAWQRAWGEEPAEQRDAAISTSSQDALPVVREPEPGAPVVDRVVQANESQDARPVVATAKRDSLVRRTCPVTLRTGFYGLLDLENEGRTEGFESLFPNATGNLLWRGSYAWYAALSLDSLARRICRRCGLEGAVAFRHESEHYTGSNSGDPGTDYSDRPHIGDLFSLDAAIRWADGDWVLVGRLQNAFFVPDRSGYSFGPAIDLHARFQPWERLHFFFSGYAENLFGAEVEGRTYPDAYLLRGLLGLALPSDLGDVMLYLSADVGHRRGIAIFTEEATVGVGVRLALGPVED